MLHTNYDFDSLSISLSGRVNDSVFIVMDIQPNYIFFIAHNIFTNHFQRTQFEYLIFFLVFKSNGSPLQEFSHLIEIPFEF